MPSRIGVILAGGQSRRFGEHKAFATYQGLPLYQHVKQALQPYVCRFVVISHPDLMARFQQASDLTVLEDRLAYQGRGPLAGIYTALSVIEADDYLVFPCDAPLVQKDLIRWLIRQSEANAFANGVAPISGKRLHPLTALYKRTCLPFIKDLLDNNQLRVKDLIENAEIPCIEVDASIDPISFSNINTKEELQILGN